MANQSALGGRKLNRQPDFNHTSIGRVTKNDRYESQGIIEVVFLDYSKPFPVWVVGDIDRKPMTGDHVLVGYIDGRKDAPYLVGHVKNKSYTTNFIEVDEKHIRIQLPVMEIGKKDGKAHNDTKTFLRDNSKKQERGYVEIVGNEIHIHHPSEVKITCGSAVVQSGNIRLNASKDKDGKGGTIAMNADVSITANGRSLI